MNGESPDEKRERYFEKVSGGTEPCILCSSVGGDVVSCSRCPRKYHLDCYIPILIDEPSKHWTCVVCMSMTEFEKMNNERDLIGGHLGVRDLMLCRRVMMQIYAKKPESNTFRFVKNIQFPLYLKLIKNPIAMDRIQEKLEIRNPEQYQSVSKFLNDVRRMFANCRSFWKNNPVGAIYVKQANKLEEHFEQSFKEWQHLINGQKPHATAGRSKIVGPASKKTDVTKVMTGDRPPQPKESWTWNNNLFNSFSVKESAPNPGKKKSQDDDWDPSME